MKKLTNILLLKLLYIVYGYNSLIASISKLDSARRKKIKSGTLIIALTTILSACNNQSSSKKEIQKTCYDMSPPQKQEEFNNLSIIKDTSYRKLDSVNKVTKTKKKSLKSGNINDILDTLNILPTDYVSPSPTCYMPALIRPEFPGGQDSLNKYLSENIKYPKIAKDSGISGTVIISFIVEKDGSIADMKIVKGISKECDAEALRVIKNMPKWKNSESSRVQFNLPLMFKLDK